MCRLLLWKCSTCKAPPHARFGSWGGAVPSARRRISRRGFGAALKPLGDAPGMARAMFKAARHCGSTDMMHMAAGLGKFGGRPGVRLVHVRHARRFFAFSAVL